MQEQKNASCCPYCGSKLGYEQCETIQRYFFFTADGTPDGASEPCLVEEMSWKRPRCMNCGKPISDLFFKHH